MASCPRCGEKGTKFLKLCGRCEQEHTIQGNLRSINPNPPIKEPEDDE